MKFMEAYNLAKQRKEVAWRNDDGVLHKTRWNSYYEKLEWVEKQGVDDYLVTLNCNTINGWEIVEEPKKTLRDRAVVSTNALHLVTGIEKEPNISERMYYEKDVKVVLKELDDWMDGCKDTIDIPIKDPTHKDNTLRMVQKKIREIFGEELLK